VKQSKSDNGGEKNIEEKVRVPRALMVELRREAARYLNKGESAPSQGQLLAEAWAFYAGARNNPDFSTGATRLDHFSYGHVTQLLPRVIGILRQLADDLATSTALLREIQGIVNDQGPSNTKVASSTVATGQEPAAEDIDRAIEEAHRLEKEYREPDRARQPRTGSDRPSTRSGGGNR
jgi:hypothetical protein